MHFGATLQLLRAHAGVSLRSLGGQVGVSAAYLSRVEHGHDAAPTTERAEAIAGALGLPRGLLVGLIDELRGDAADWLRATAMGRRLSAALRRRDLTEAQLARVLAFVEREFPVGAAAGAVSVRGLLEPERVLVRVQVGQLDDLWTLAALRLAAGPAAATLLAALRAGGPEALACVGDGVAIGFVSEGGPLRLGLVVCEVPLPLTPPDGVPVRVVWVAVGLPTGAAGAAVLAAVAGLAEPGLVRELVGARSAAAALAAVAHFEGR